MVETGIRDFKANGLYVRYAKPVSSNVPSILMIPGGFQSAQVYDNFLRYFAKHGWNSYAVSLRGHTGSEIPRQQYINTSIVDYAEDVHIVATKIGEPVIVLGHSMGGRVALEYASRYRSLATICIAPSSPKGCGVPPRTDFPQPPEGELYTPQFVTKGVLMKLIFYAPDADPEVMERQWKLTCPESPLAVFELCANLVLNNSRISSPTAIFTGEHDEAHSKVDKLVADFVGAEHIFLWGTGHAPHLHKSWEKSAERIERWLRTQEFP